MNPRVCHCDCPSLLAGTIPIAHARMCSRGRSRWLCRSNGAVVAGPQGRRLPERTECVSESAPKLARPPTGRAATRTKERCSRLCFRKWRAGLPLNAVKTLRPFRALSGVSRMD